MSEVVLVTGASGLLGAACINTLLGRGCEVVAVVRDADPRSRFYQDGLVDRCIEVRDELANAHRLLAEYQPDRILHLAAQTQVPVANRDPLSTFESNVRGTWLLMEACRTAPKAPRAIVVASSDKAYGPGEVPYVEDSPLQAEAPYDVSKAATDMIARSYGTQFGLPVVVTRCGNLYGPGDLNDDRLIPGVCKALAQGRTPQLRSTGTMTREWLFVDDAAAATLLLADRAPTHAGHAFNVGGGEVASATEVADQLAELAGSPHRARAAPADPPGEIPHQSLDTSRIRRLGWSPTTPLHDGLAQTYRWYQQMLGTRSSHLEVV